MTVAFYKGAARKAVEAKAVAVEGDALFLDERLAAPRLTDGKTVAWAWAGEAWEGFEVTA